MPALLRLLLALQLSAIAAAFPSDGDLLLAAKSALSDPTGALAGWQTGDALPCRWPHVSCSSHSFGAVVGLYLFNLSLAGPFPDALCSLRSLERLDLNQNNLEGPVPACLAALPALTHLGLGGNNFSGEFPAFLANLTTLRVLQLAYNPFSPSPFPEELLGLADLRVLFLASCSLIGNIPSSIGRLRNLANLDLSRNSLTGEIPRGVVDLASLEQIELFSNQLSGEIPVGYGACRKLRMLDMSMNRLTGKIPEDMFRAPSLTSVHIYQNHLTGPLPATMETAPNLSDVRIFGNQLEGPLPAELGKNLQLSFLDMSDNRLSGPIPATLCASGKLTEVMLLGNQFDGAIPAELGQCQTLTRVRLHGNRLSGPVPPGVWGLPHVGLLDLHDNELSGTIDPAIAGAKNLSDLDIQDNRFSGVLPEELGALPKLQELVASNCGFSGPLPPSLAEAPQLYLIDLSNNSLSGEIPPGFGKMKKLTTLDLSDNHLSGSIPPGLISAGRINSLDLSNNELSGTLPPNDVENIMLTHFNVSFNKLWGPIPRFFHGSQFQYSFLGNPGLCHGFCQSHGNFVNNRHTLVKLVVTIVGAAVIILLISVAWFGYKCRTHRGVAAESSDENSIWALTSFHKVDFSQRDIVNSLNENNVIGQGAAGKVYKVVVGPHGKAMAVKKLWARNEASSRNNDCFEAEVETLGKVRHKNIVKLACCITNRVSRLLVYEYMPNGSLGDFLHSAKSSILSWPMRYKIACDAAEGLSYLHHDCVPPVIHRDVKSNNILLDAEFSAKVADFGLARTIGTEPATMSAVAGSYGYIAPEYAYTLRVTEKSDIYSFGVVLLELVTGKKPMAPEINEMDLVTWVSTTIGQNGPESVLDDTLAAEFKDEMCRILKIGQLCASNLPNHRPPMRIIAKMLQEVKGASQPKLPPPAI